ncbi:JMJD8 [Branchiostoma lanceolatum]|uniref:JMJD8 protein n=1 Tax=Branchiostoma lanceolatum TaxID=7740 RepID=A0A8J9VZU7_BRALA|nr:JMJD8 [Branchiostoma lanceolatum]
MGKNNKAAELRKRKQEKEENGTGHVTDDDNKKTKADTPSRRGSGTRHAGNPTDTLFYVAGAFLLGAILMAFLNGPKQTVNLPTETSPKPVENTNNVLENTDKIKQPEKEAKSFLPPEPEKANQENVIEQDFNRPWYHYPRVTDKSTKISRKSEEIHPDKVDSIQESDTPGGWKSADRETRQTLSTSSCLIDRHYVDDVTPQLFKDNFRYKNPLIIRFRSGASGWINTQEWSKRNLLEKYSGWTVRSGTSLDIVRNGGVGDNETSFYEFLSNMAGQKDEEPRQVYDRDFYRESHLDQTVNPPAFLSDIGDDVTFSVGTSRSGVAFHTETDGWSGLVFGRQRWFLYPPQHTPPGGFWPGYSVIDWFTDVYPKLKDKTKPMECVLEEGEILYLPEGYYHSVLNIGETVSIKTKRKDASTNLGRWFFEGNRNDDRLVDPQYKSKEQAREGQVHVFKKLHELLPENAEVMLRYSQALADVDRTKEAKQLNQRVIEADPFFVQAYLSLAQMYTELGFLGQAEILFKAAIRMNTKCWDAYAQYGDFLLNRAGKGKDAAKIYQKGVEARPDMKAFYLRLLQAQQRARQTGAVKETTKLIQERFGDQIL